MNLEVGGFFSSFIRGSGLRVRKFWPLCHFGFNGWGSSPHSHLIPVRTDEAEYSQFKGEARRYFLSLRRRVL